MCLQTKVSRMITLHTDNDYWNRFLWWRVIDATSQCSVRDDLTDISNYDTGFYGVSRPSSKPALKTGMAGVSNWILTLYQPDRVTSGKIAGNKFKISKGFARRKKERRWWRRRKEKEKKKKKRKKKKNGEKKNEKKKKKKKNKRKRKNPGENQYTNYPIKSEGTFSLTELYLTGTPC